MMGVPTNEVEEVLQNAKADLRIVGFEGEEKRLKQRISHGLCLSLKLPQGQYIFCEFRTLQIPGIEVLFFYMIIHVCAQAKNQASLSFILYSFLGKRERIETKYFGIGIDLIYDLLQCDDIIYET